MKFVLVSASPPSMSDTEKKTYGDAVFIDSMCHDVLKSLERPECTALPSLKWYERSYISELYLGVVLSKNTICTFLADLGGAYQKIVSFMKNRISEMAKGQDIIIDGTLRAAQAP